MKQYVILFIGACLFFSCSDRNMEAQLKQLSEKNESLKDSIKNLQDSLEAANLELIGYRNSPEKLCSNLDGLYSKCDTIKLFEIQAKLEKYHPESEKVKEVKDLISEIRLTIKKKAEAEKKQRMAAVSKLIKRKNDVLGITWFYNPYYNHYDNVTGTSIYIGKSESTIWLRLKMSYGGDDWIFFDSAYLWYDGNTKYIKFDKYKDKQDDCDGDGVGEWIDISVDKELLSFLKSMVKGKKLKMQLMGKYSETKALSHSEINGIKAILLAYDVLKSESGMTSLEDLFAGEDLATE